MSKVTHSSGNHGQALALAAQKRGIPAYIIVPKSAPQVKIDAMVQVSFSLKI
jgi:threonine dehydratase